MLHESIYDEVVERIAKNDDVKAVVLPVLRHRLILTYQANAEGVSASDVIATLLDLVTVEG